MSKDEQDLILVRALRRLRRAKKELACSRSGLLSWARHMKRIARGIEHETIYITHTGHFAVEGESESEDPLTYGDRERLAASVEQLCRAKKEFEEAERDWNQLKSIDE